MPSADAEILEIAGREVRVTSPGKVLFSEHGETKLDLIEQRVMFISAERNYRPSAAAILG